MSNTTDIIDGPMSPRRTFPPGRPPEDPGSYLREMGRKIQAKAIEKGWNPAELSRQVAKRLPGKRLTRTDVYKYWRGETLPGPVRRRALAAALEMSEDVLFSGVPVEMTDKSSSFAMRTLSDGNVWLHLNLSVPPTTALEIMSVLYKANIVPKG